MLRERAIILEKNNSFKLNYYLKDDKYQNLKKDIMEEEVETFFTEKEVELVLDNLELFF